MAMMRWDPMHELRMWTKRMEHVFEPFLPLFGNFNVPMNLEPNTMVGMGLGFWPNVDIWEDKEKMMFRVELPGMEMKDVELMVDDNVLTLRGERKLEHVEKKDHFHRVEGSYGTFCRTFVLPGHIDKDHIKAHMKNGMLEIHVPKLEVAKGKLIPIIG
jgi:HSP20 family protein